MCHCLRLCNGNYCRKGNRACNIQPERNERVLEEIDAAGSPFFWFFYGCIYPILYDAVAVGYMQNAMFGMVIGCYIVLNESISICENIYRANPEIMPKWIKHMLVATRKQIDMGEKNENK